MTSNISPELYYDVIIIGTGLAGLYAATEIKRLTPNKRFLILEKNTKKDIGGRAGNDMFYGTELAIGAGVGRKHKDSNLITLLRQTKVQTSEFPATREYITPFQPIDIMKIMKRLQSEYKTNPTAYKSKNFKEFFITVMGDELYRKFIITSGYTDYENADIYETLYKYGMDDNTSGGWTAIHIPWKDLTNKLYENIGKEHFKFSSEVTNITQMRTHPSFTLFQISTRENHKNYYSNKIIVATTISGIKKITRDLIPTNSRHKIAYQQIRGQPFLMVYAKFDKSSSDIMKNHVKTFTVVSNQLQKLIPMNPDKGVYMIAYTDNAHAIALKRHLENTRANCDMYSKLVENALGINDLNILSIKSYYWDEGTHYYTPLSSDFKNRNEFIRIIQYPCESVAVVGEAVSRNQGWVEGALESVNAAITPEWLHKHNMKI